ncbi:hypothetical protein SORBI_3005G068400 [Sorghum bicolor]|uniref:Uncharacterized protein n=1 Tax=Sorghum bicolor TaxID=4558 RepID=A0A1B6PQK6_SORBI|nr:hypothetical protein SORBI_3005G068400 [Sorghum bicolor]
MVVVFFTAATIPPSWYLFYKTEYLPYPSRRRPANPVVTAGQAHYANCRTLTKTRKLR